MRYLSDCEVSVRLIILSVHKIATFDSLCTTAVPTAITVVNRTEFINFFQKVI